MDDVLRSSLWNALYLCVWKSITYDPYVASTRLEYSNLFWLFQVYWHHYFKKPLDTLPAYFEDVNEIVRNYFFSCKWNEVYDFIEFTANETPNDLSKEFIKFCNKVLKSEMSAFRFVGKEIGEITSEEEISSIEDALKKTSMFDGIQEHLTTALALLFDRKDPDFRNSIKESISAVEALAKILTRKPKATLGDALKILEEEANIHPALKTSLSALYGYTSDADGIRHAMMDESNLTFNDAKFVLVTCTAFVNYLLGKAAENTKLEKLLA